MESELKFMDWTKDTDRMKEWKSTKSCGTVKYIKRHDSIVIDPKGHEYYIEMDRLKTAEQAFCWICHLHQKIWFTPQMLSDLVYVITRTTTINEYCDKD